MSIQFIISDCSVSNGFLGLKFEFSYGMVKSSQEKFIDKHLIKFEMSDS